MKKQRRPVTGDLVLEAAAAVHGSGEALRLYGLAVLARRKGATTPEKLRAMLEPHTPDAREGMKELFRELRAVRQRVAQVAHGADPGAPLDALLRLADAGAD